MASSDINRLLRLKKVLKFVNVILLVDVVLVLAIIVDCLMFDRSEGVWEFVKSVGPPVMNTVLLLVLRNGAIQHIKQLEEEAS